MGTLVTHIGSGYAAEADASLDVLSDLVESHPDVMAPFAIFIKVGKTTGDISERKLYLRWLNRGFQFQYLPSFSIKLVVICKDLEK